MGVDTNISTTAEASPAEGWLRTRWRAIDPSWRWALKLFAGYRVLFSFWAAWVSSAYPKFAEEAAITLWPINDRVAREWIEDYYEARLERGLEASDAARDASRALLKARRAAGQSVHPYFWAAFITTG